MNPEETSSRILRITQGQSEGGRTVQGSHTLALGGTSSNAETAIVVTQPATSARGWWALGGL